MPDPQRTEKPTPRRIERARREGRFPASRDLPSAAQFVAFALLLAAFGPDWYGRLAANTRGLIHAAFTRDLDAVRAIGLTRMVVTTEILPLGAAAAALAGATLAVHLATTHFGVAVKPLVPNFRRLNVLSRIRELPRQNVPLFLQALVLLPLFGTAVYGVVTDNLEAMLRLPLQTVEQGAQQLGDWIQDLVWKAALLFVALGAFDYWRQHRRYLADLRMTRHEVREEAKELEANPQIKGRIRRLQREWLRRRMMQQVPKATAVVVNPTHYAVALRYAMESITAPMVVAKGKNYLAQLIRKKAIEHQVPIVENPPLARALHAETEIGDEIPAATSIGLGGIATDVGWLAQPVRYIEAKSQSPERSPVKIRPVRLPP